MKKPRSRKIVALYFALSALGVTALTLSACGGGGDTDKSLYTVGGTVTGLSDTESVVLVNNGTDLTTVSSNRDFTFSVAQTSGTDYAVTVKSRTPGIACAVTKGTGTLASAHVTSVAVSCGAAKLTVLSSFDGANHGDTPMSALIADSAGNFYGTTRYGGSFGNGTVFKLSPNGNGYDTSILYNFGSANADGAQPRAGLTMDGAGNLYGTTSLGGTHNQGTVFKLSPNGTDYVQGVIYNFGDAASDGATPLAGLIMDAEGSLYGTTYNGGSANMGTVFKLSHNGNGYEESFLYSFSGNAGGANPLAALLMDSAGNLYGTTAYGGADEDSGTVFKFTADGGTYRKSNLVTFIYGDVPHSSLLMDSAGNLYGTFEPNNGSGYLGSVYKISPIGERTTLGEEMKGMPFGGLVMDSAGNLYGTTARYSSDTLGSDTIFKINPSGQFTTLYTFDRTVTSGPSSAPGSNGAVPIGSLIMDRAGNLYGTASLGGANSRGTVFKLGD